MALLHPRISGFNKYTGNAWVEEGHVALYSLVYDVILRKINLTLFVKINHVIYILDSDWLKMSNMIESRDYNSGFWLAQFPRFWLVEVDCFKSGKYNQTRDYLVFKNKIISNFSLWFQIRINL